MTDIPDPIMEPLTLDQARQFLQRTQRPVFFDAIPAATNAIAKLIEDGWKITPPPPPPPRYYATSMEWGDWGVVDREVPAHLPLVRRIVVRYSGSTREDNRYAVHPSAEITARAEADRLNALLDASPTPKDTP